MAFSMSRTWSDSIGLIRERWVTLIVIMIAMQAIGLLAFLPFMSDWLVMFQPTADPEVQLQRLMAVMPKMMGVSLLANLVQLAAYGALVALLGSDRPGIGEALVRGLKATPTFVVALVFLVVGLYAAMLAVVLVVVLVIMLFAGAASLQGGAAGALMAGPLVLVVLVAYFGVLVAMMYFALRFVTLLPVIVIERVYNPFTVIARCWRLTHRDSWKILGFWLLMWIGIGIVFSTIMLAVASSVFQIGGPPPTIESLIPLWIAMVPLNIVLVPLLTAMVVATYDQLASEETLAEAQAD